MLIPVGGVRRLRRFMSHKRCVWRCFSEGVAKPEISADSKDPAETPSVKRPMTFGRFVLYATGALCATGFSYYFYQAGGNLHKTEILISKRLAQLPLYYPPGPTQSERNVALPIVSMPPGLVDQISAWFISKDGVLPEGLTREDVLVLCGQLGLVQPEESDYSPETNALVSKFIEKGKGRLTEHKRLSGVSLSETLELVNSLVEDPEPVAEKMHAILAESVLNDQPQQITAMIPEVDASERDLLEMELAQAVRMRLDLTSRSVLSDAEKTRLVDCERTIRELEQELVGQQ